MLWIDARWPQHLLPPGAPTQPSLPMQSPSPSGSACAFPTASPPAPLPYAAEIRWIERANDLAETAAPPHWTTARVEAWLDWADGLPSDLPPASPAALALEGAEPLLAGGPDRYARRLAAWGLALGVFADEPEAARFHAELNAALALGVIATARQLPFGARVNPLAPDTATAPPLALPELGRTGFGDAARALRAGRGIAAGLASGAAQRLAAVALAVIRCEGDRAACASLDSNQALARAAWAARAAGHGDAAVADAIALGRAGVDVATSACGAATAKLIAVADRAGVVAGSDAARGAAALAWETSALTIAFSQDDAERLALAEIAPRGAVNALAFERADGFDAEGFADAVRLALLALDIEGRAGFVADPADAYRRSAVAPDRAGAGGRRRAGRRARHGLRQRRGPRAGGGPARQALAAADTMSAALGAAHAVKLCAFEDPEISLRLGGLTLGAAPWSGPVTLAETADGALPRTLGRAGAAAARRAGLDAGDLRAACSATARSLTRPASATPR